MGDPWTKGMNLCTNHRMGRLAASKGLVYDVNSWEYGVDTVLFWAAIVNFLHSSSYSTLFWMCAEEQC